MPLIFRNFALHFILSRIIIIFEEGHAMIAHHECVTTDRLMQSLRNGDFTPEQRAKISDCNGCRTVANDLAVLLEEKARTQRIPAISRHLENLDKLLKTSRGLKHAS